MHPNTASPRPWRDYVSPRQHRLQRAWLCRPGALTAGLRQLGKVRLQVLREAIEHLPASWADESGLATGCAVWWREILMFIDGTPAVQACSFTPRAASLGAWKAMRGLGQRPLADILYQDPRIQRSPFRFGRLHAKHDNEPWVGTQKDTLILARHSVFVRLDQPLLVAEYFLPGFWDIAGQADLTKPLPRFRLCECG